MPRNFAYSNVLIPGSPIIQSLIHTLIITFDIKSIKNDTKFV
jgi:hypothetical protein